MLMLFNGHAYAFLISHSDSFVFFAFVVSSFTVSLRDIPLRVGTWARVEGIVTHQERAHMHRCTHESPKNKKISQVAANSFGDNNVPFIHQEHSLGWRSVLIEGSRSNFEAVRTILYHPKRHLKANERTNKQHPFHCFKSLKLTYRLPTFESIYGDARCFKGKVESAGGQRYQNTCCYM